MTPCEPGSGEAISEPDSRSEVVARGRLGRRDLFLLALVALGGIWLRVVQIRESLWLDELHTAWTVAAGWDAVSWRAAIGNQSPLYFYLVKAFTSSAGLHEATLRAPSAMAGVALIVAAAWIVTGWTGSRAAGLLAALLLAVDRHCLFYAQEARPYALVQLLGLVHVALFIRLLHRPDRLVRGLWIATGLGLVYLHYTAILLLPAQLLVFAGLQMRARWRPRYGWRHFFVDGAILAVGLLPALPQVFRIAGRRDAWSLFIPNNVPAWAILTQFPLDIYLLLPAVVCLAAWAVCLLGARIRPSRGLRRQWLGQCRQSPRKDSLRLALLVVICWLFVPLTLAWIATVGDWARLFFLRYVIVSAAAAPILAGFIAAFCPGRISQVACAVAVTVAAVWHGGLLPQFQRDGRVIGDRQQDWRGAVEWLQLRAADGTAPVFVRSGLIEADRLRGNSEPQLVEYCLLPVRGIYRLDIPSARLIPLPTTRSSDLDEQQLSRIAAAGEAWFLLSGTPRSVDVMGRKLREVLSRRSRSAAVAERQSFGNVAVLRLIVE